MKRLITFDSIFVLQSLPEGDKMTGSNLYNDLLSRRVRQMPGFHTEIHDISDKEVFDNLMNQIKIACSNNDIRPYLHFEMHGCKEGIQLSNRELLTWEKLYNYFVKINEILRNQLFVSFATCYGAYIFQVIDPLKRSPMFGFIGPSDQISADNIEIDFYGYFDVLLSTKDFDLAIEALNNTNHTNKYVFNTSELIFNE
ncbi:MAG: hypothetical protein V5804_17655, partial [Mucilaginibacter sp.]|uniref:hypothetical protein n=1 Tax=Mucilaginibacter sp. TaxID=1882438 RepID=UPI0034E5C774